MTEYIAIITTNDPTIEEAGDLATQLDAYFPPAEDTATVLVPITDNDAGVVYTPHVDPNGAVGFKATDLRGNVEYILLNPSGGSDDGVATVFLYIGQNGDVQEDMPVIHFEILED